MASHSSVLHYPGAAPDRTLCSRPLTLNVAVTSEKARVSCAGCRARLEAGA